MRLLLTNSRFRWSVLVLVALGLVCSRRPDALLVPQFYMEDGTLWYVDAHETGVSAIFLPARGYFQTSARLAAFFACMLPLGWAPLTLALLAIAVDILPALVIASDRFERVLPARWNRLLLAALYLGLPNTWTTIANVTHSQWRLALLAAVIVLSRPAATRAWKIFDAVSLSLAALSGPFAIFLFPVAGVMWWRDRGARTLANLAIVTAGAMIQAIAIVATAGTNPVEPTLAASPAAFFRIISSQIVYSGLFGQQGYEAMHATPDAIWMTAWASAGVSLVFFAACAAVLWRAPVEIGLLFAYAALVLMAALVNPPVPGPWWDLLQGPGFAPRYFLLALFACATVIAWALGQSSRWFVLPAAAILLVVIVFGARLDWRQPAQTDYNFKASVEKYNRAQPGQKVQIPHPPGWAMLLTKH